MKQYSSFKNSKARGTSISLKEMFPSRSPGFGRCGGWEERQKGVTEVSVYFNKEIFLGNCSKNDVSRSFSRGCRAPVKDGTHGIGQVWNPPNISGWLLG